MDVLVENAIREERERLKKGTQKEQSDTTAAFNAVSGVLKGLAELKNRPGSKLEFAAREAQFGMLSYVVDTNIPLYGDHQNCIGSLHVNVEPNGRLVIIGDVTPNRAGREHFSYSCSDAPAQAVAEVARHALRRGLIP